MSRFPFDSKKLVGITLVLLATTAVAGSGTVFATPSAPTEPVGEHPPGTLDTGSSMGDDPVRFPATGNTVSDVALASRWTDNLTAATGSNVPLGVRSDVAAMDGTAYVAGTGIGNNVLSAVRTANGSIQWSRSLGPGSPVGLSAPARMPGRPGHWNGNPDWTPENVFVADYSGTIHALNADTGETTWTAETGFGSYVGDPLLGDKRLYVTAYDPATGTTHLQAYAADDGSRLWSTKLGTGIGLAAPAGSSDRLVVALDNTVYTVNTGTGAVTQTTEVSGPVFGSPVLTPGMGTAVVASVDGTVTAVNLDSGDTRWQQDVGRNTTAPVVAAGQIVVGGDALYALAPADGSTVWTADIGKVTAPATVAKGTVYAVTSDNTLSAVNANTGKRSDSITLSDLGAPVRAAPAVDGQMSIVADTNGFVMGVKVGQSGTENPGETTSGDGPGFGVVSVIVALLAVVAARLAWTDTH